MPLVLLAGVVGEATRDLADRKRPRRGRDDLLRMLVRARERDPRLDPRPSAIAEKERGIVFPTVFR